MFWRGETEGSRTVALTWTREELDTGSDARVLSRETISIPDATWTMRDGNHYLTYHEQGDHLHSAIAMNGSASHGGLRTTLRIEPAKLTYIRHGAIRWNHSFQADRSSASTMYIGAMCAAVETWTEQLVIEVTEHAGSVELVYRMDIDGESNLVKLVIQFGWSV